MNGIPDTRNSLMLRLRDQEDELAWSEFTEIYRPLVYRLARSKGFQDADAHELAQKALIAVMSAIERWDPDPALGSFRSWLYRTSRNVMINHATRLRPDCVGTGNSEFHKLLEQQPARSDSAESEFRLEYRRELFRWAVERVRGRFQEKTWRAFWQTAVEGRPIPESAASLELSVGAVYAARSRVMSELKRRIFLWERAESGDPT